MQRLILGALLLLPATQGAASDKIIEQRYTATFNQCTTTGDAAAGVQPAMNQCAADEYQRQDIRLNRRYVAVMTRLTTAGKARLRTLQRGWIKQRDQRCAAEQATYDGGSMAPLIFHTCMTNETIKRIIWLEKYR